MSDINKLLERRAQLLTEARSILDKADAEDRDLRSDEVEVYEKICADVDSLDARIERSRGLESRASVAEVAGATKRSISLEEPESRGKPNHSEEQRNLAFRKFLSHGEKSLSEAEQRTLVQSSNPDGGYLVAPMQFVNDLIKTIDNQVFIRQLATIFPLNQAVSLGVPTLDTDPADAEWTSETSFGTVDSSMKLGRRQMTPTDLAKYAKISKKLIRQAPSVENLVRDRLGYKFAIAQENAFFNGTGSGQPLGVMTAHSDGISTARDISSGNTTTAITFDGLINAVEELKEQYQARATWCFHKDAIKMLRKIKDGDGQYIWRASTVAGSPDTLLGLPFKRSEYCPKTFTTGLYVGIVGDFSNYWIAESLSFSVQVAMERFIDENAIGYFGRQELDGAPVLEEAFSRIKLA